MTPVGVVVTTRGRERVNNKLTAIFYFLVWPGGGNFRPQFLSEGGWGCQVCFKYLSYTSNLVESFKRF